MRRANGFTLVELSVCIAVVGTGLAAVMSLVPQLTGTADAGHHIATAVGLAELLIQEMDALPFEDTAATCTFGVETDESDANRADFDDLDDYDGYTDTPPKDRNGNPDNNYADYNRSVAVVNVSTADLTTEVADGTTDCKQITVIVRRKGQELARLTVLRFFGANRADALLLEETLTPVED